MADAVLTATASSASSKVKCTKVLSLANVLLEASNMFARCSKPLQHIHKMLFPTKKVLNGGKFFTMVLAKKFSCILSPNNILAVSKFSTKR